MRWIPRPGRLLVLLATETLEPLATLASSTSSFCLRLFLVGFGDESGDAIALCVDLLGGDARSWTRFLLFGGMVVRLIRDASGCCTRRS